MQRACGRYLPVLLVVTGVAAVAGLVGSGGAAAASCPPPPPVVHPFAPWGDPMSYVLTTGGSFEPGSAAWSLSGGAGVVPGNEPFHVNGPNDGYSLSLPEGASATSACVTAPLILGTVRFFVASTGASTGQLEVETVVKGKTYPAGTISAGAWAPSPILISTAPPYKGAVSFQIRLTAIGAGAAFDVDDVYFDPMKHQ